jgi:hypothetical protein
MQERAVSQPTRITFARSGRLDDVFGNNRAGRRCVFFGAVWRVTRLHSTPCVLESIFENTYRRRVKCPVSVLLDEAPHGPDSRLLNGRERSAFPVAAIPFAASNSRYSTSLFIAGLRHTRANPVYKALAIIPPHRGRRHHRH